MNSGLQVFQNEEFGSIRVIDKDGELWFVATDVAKALGYRDAEKMTRRLDSKDVRTHLAGTDGLSRNVSMVNEAGLYTVVLTRKSAFAANQNTREAIERFQRWVTHEVLPAIRRSGGYMVDVAGETPEQTMARALNCNRNTTKQGA